MKHASLTGAWSGAYRYPADLAPETVFEIDIEEGENGVFSGSTREPNLTRPWMGPVVTATIDGTRTGATVSFVKFMDGSGGMHHSIRYEGVANAALTRVEGEWIIRNEWSGTFFMERTDHGDEEAIARTAEARR